MTIDEKRIRNEVFAKACENLKKKEVKIYYHKYKNLEISLFDAKAIKKDEKEAVPFSSFYGDDLLFQLFIVVEHIFHYLRMNISLDHIPGFLYVI